MRLVADGAVSFVLIVEYNRNACLCHARLSLLVYELLQRVHTNLSELMSPSVFTNHWPYLGQVGDSQHKADSIENIRLAAAVETRNRVEVRVEPRDLGSSRVRLETVQNNFGYIHDEG